MHIDPIEEGAPVSSVLIKDTDYSINAEGLNLVVYDRKTECVIDSVALYADENNKLVLIHRGGATQLICDYKRAKYNIDRGLPL